LKFPRGWRNEWIKNRFNGFSFLFIEIGQVTSMLNFNFATAQRILFGTGRFRELGKLAAEFGRRVCLVTGGRSLEASHHLATLDALFKEAGLEWMQARIEHEPTVENVDQGTALARQFGAEVVISVGGGSVIDGGKAIAALLANGGETLDYLEGVGRGRTLAKPSVPFIAVPTTAGTGSEATKNAVISDEARTFKKSMRSDWMLPTVALVDPELTYTCPLSVSAACGMDALAQLLEAFTSRRANPMIDTLAGLGLMMSGYLPRIKDNPPNPTNATVREALSMASLLSGIALANAGLGAVHGLASPLGAFFPIPHGNVCAILLPAVVRANARRAHDIGDAWLLEKYSAAAFQLVRAPDGTQVPPMPMLDRLTAGSERPLCSLDVALALSEYLESLRHELGIAGLARYGVSPEDFPQIIDGARGSSMKTNPVDLTDEDLGQILEESL
jgi:alcohol dehydrogenase